jgi:hypothetical protein
MVDAELQGIFAKTHSAKKFQILFFYPYIAGYGRPGKRKPPVRKTVLPNKVSAGVEPRANREAPRDPQAALASRPLECSDAAHNHAPFQRGKRDETVAAE